MRKPYALRLAILTDGIFPYVIGGMQKHSFYLTKFLVELGVDVTLYHCVTQGEIPSESQVFEDLSLPSDGTFRSECIPFPKGNGLPGHYIRSNYLYSIQQGKKVEKENYDLIYAKGFAAWQLIDRKKKGAKLPPIAVKFHGYEMFQPAPDFKTKLQHYLLRGPVTFNNKHADFVFSYGGKITPIIESLGVAKDRIIDIPTGIASSWLRREEEIMPQPKTKLMFLGRYERRKGIEELNEALNQLMGEVDFEVEFVGPIPASKHLKHDNITYHGKIMAQKKLQEIMDQCSVLLCPSHSEGMPNVIMEGMARGLAVLATDVGAVSIQVDPQVGWLIKPANKEALIKILREINACSSAELLSKRRAAHQKIASRFTWEKVAEQTLSTMQALIPMKSEV